MKTLARLLTGPLLALSILLGACKPSPPPDEITVQLKWVHQAQFAGFYVAQEEGYYAEEHLNVTLLEAEPDADVIQEVVSGRADVGVAAPELIMVEQSKGAPVLAVAVVYQRNPLVFVSLADSGIVRPQDFVGRRVAYGVSDELQLPALIENLGLDIDQIELVPFNYDYEPFYQGQIDVTYAYATGGLIRMQQAGHEVNLIWPSDYGIHLYADTLFTSAQFAEEHPDVVTRFLRATIKGWRQAVEDRERAVAATMSYALEKDIDLQRAMMEASVPLVHTGDGPIGWMEDSVWQDMHDMLIEQHVLDHPLDMSRVYTTSFLRQIYGDAP